MIRLALSLNVCWWALFVFFMWGDERPIPPFLAVAACTMLVVSGIGFHKSLR